MMHDDLRTDDILPSAVRSATITVFGVELTVVVLDDGRRLIEGDGMERLFEHTGEFCREDADKLIAAIAEA